MNQRLFSSMRLHALLGDGVHDLPEGFLPQLERLMAEGRLALAASGHEGVLRNRNLEGLSAVLEVLEAAELERGNGGEQGLLGDHVVRGLLVAARQLTAGLFVADAEVRNAAPVA